MEPVLTQEELEAIYAAMKGDDLPSVSVDDVAIAAGHEFVSSAEARWDKTVKQMMTRVSSIMTGALGVRANVRFQPSEAVIEDEHDGSGSDNMPLMDGSSVLTTVQLGDIKAIVAVDMEIARRFIERRTGAKRSEEASGAGNHLTSLESRLLRDLVNDLAQAAGAVAPKPLSGSVSNIDPGDVWANREEGELWITGCLALVELGGRGIRLAAPAKLYLPTIGNVRDKLTSHLKNTPVVLVAELGKFKTTVQKLWHIRPGALIPIDTTVGDPLNIVINGIPKLYGDPLVSRGNIAISVSGRHENNGVNK